MSELIDVKTIALNLEVSRQTVYNHIEKNNQALSPYLKKLNGVTYLKSDGIEIIKESLGLIEVPVVQKQEIGIEEIMQELKESIKDNIEMSMQNVREDIEENLKSDYEKLELELQEVKKQNETLIQMIQDQAEKKEEKRNFFDIFRKK